MLWRGGNAALHSVSDTAKTHHIISPTCLIISSMVLI